MRSVKQQHQTPSERQAEAARIGERLRWAREANSLNFVELAAAVGVDESMIRKLERGGCTPSVYLTLSLCHVLGISPSYLLWASLVEVHEAVRSKIVEAHPDVFVRGPASPFERKRRKSALST